jgi:hypothetical protein
MNNSLMINSTANLAHKLNLGCGNNKIQGFVNVDSNPACHPDLLVELDNGLGAFSDNSIDEIRAEHVLEHVGDLLLVLSEMYRVSKHGATWEISVPHYSYGFVHPFHKRGFCCHTFDWFFSKTSPENYGNLSLIVKAVRLNYMRSSSPFVRFIVFPVNLIANLSKSFCERIWCYWVGGFEEIHFTIQVDKRPSLSEPTTRSHKE